MRGPAPLTRCGFVRMGGAVYRPLLVSWLLLGLGLGACRTRHPDPSDRRIQRGGPAATLGSHDGLTLVSFNVQHAGAAALIRAVRSDAVLRRADVLLLQEMEVHPWEGGSRTAVVGEALGMAHAYAPRYGLPGGGTHGLAILSRRALSDLEVIELPTYDLHYNNGRVIALAATVSMGSQRVRLYNTHLDTRITPGERLAQLRPLVERAAGQEAAVVAGDFNSTPFTWLLRRVPLPGAANNAKIERLMDAHGLEMAGTSVVSTTRILGLCLDWIYVRGLGPRAAGVRDGVRLGDHYPVWAAFGAASPASR